jgi:membrane fusion protein (multidrug efflux system)
METRTQPGAPPPPRVESEPPNGSPPNGDAAPKAPPQRRVLIFSVAGIALLLALIFGIRYLVYALAHESTDDAQIDADLVEVTSKISERVDRILVDTNQRVTKGQLLVQLDDVDERQRVAQAKAALDAQLAQANAARENVSLTSDQQRAQNEQYAGGISQARANRLSASAQASSQEEEISALQAAADASRAQLKAAQDAVPGARQGLAKAQADLNRTQSLVRTGDLSISQLDTSQADFAAASSSYSQSLANVAAAQANVVQAEEKVDAQRAAANAAFAQIGVQRGAVTTAQGRLAESAAPSRVPAQQAQANAAAAQAESYQAQLANAQTQLSYTRIASPINGYVGQKNVEVGQTVSPGLSLMTLVPANHVYVTANFKETQLRNMRVGQPVDISVDACHGIPLHGHVENLSPAAQNKFSLVPPQNATGNFVKVTQRLPVRIAFDDPDPRCPLRPGLSVVASVKVK